MVGDIFRLPRILFQIGFGRMLHLNMCADILKYHHQKYVESVCTVTAFIV